MKKYGIIGGTFNPIHNAHIYIAYEAMRQLNLDKVIFMVAGVPPHKLNKEIVEATARLDMVKLAIQDYKEFEASDYEIQKKGLSYTYETLETLKTKDVELFFITGADCLLNIEKWKNPQRILNSAKFVVFNRGGYNLENLNNQKSYIEKKYKTNILFLNIINLEISSSIIRNRIKSKERVDFFIPSSVLSYIKQNNLYSEKGEVSMTINEIKTYLKQNLKEGRYNHVLGVVETAKELAKINNVSEEKAEIAALGHDIAKNLTTEEMLKIIEKANIILSKSEEKTKELWHSIIAPILAKEKLGILDEEILSAMRWHTTGKENMSKLEKIIYIADMIEPGRNFPGVQELRKATYEDLDKGVLMGLNHTINYLSKKNLLIDENTIKARNYLNM